MQSAPSISADARTEPNPKGIQAVCGNRTVTSPSQREHPLSVRREPVDDGSVLVYGEPFGSHDKNLLFKRLPDQFDQKTL